MQIQMICPAQGHFSKLQSFIQHSKKYHKISAQCAVRCVLDHLYSNDMGAYVSPKKLKKKKKSNKPKWDIVENNQQICITIYIIIFRLWNWRRSRKNKSTHKTGCARYRFYVQSTMLLMFFAVFSVVFHITS